MEKRPCLIEKNATYTFTRSSQEPTNSSLTPSATSTKSVRNPYAFSKKTHARSIPTVDELLSKYVKLTDMISSDDSLFIEIIHARNEIRTRIISAACREDRLVEISKNLMDVEMTMFEHRPAKSDGLSTD